MPVTNLDMYHLYTLGIFVIECFHLDESQKGFITFHLNMVPVWNVPC